MRYPIRSLPEHVSESESTTRAPPPAFRGTARFEIEGCLGQGGMGVVYRAFDRERGTPVALKTLRHVDPASLYRFKREFRSLARVTHDNVVSLHELGVVDGQWFFTMELLDGRRFLDYVRGIDRDATGRGAEPEPTVSGALGPARPSTGATTTPSSGRARGTLAPPPSDPLGFADALARLRPAALADDELTRLRASLAQLTEGVCALHATGCLHRDLKPSNVLVTSTGRVVVLDFGIVLEQASERWHADVPERLGTPAYMAPEQARGAANASRASDWYSVGVMLFEALAGLRPPFGPDGRPPPSAFRPGVPADLDDLCMALLHPDPTARPTGDDVRARLRAGATAPPVERAKPDVARTRPIAELPFIGRERHLHLLRRAFADAQRGRGTAVYVHGESGVGKSALVRRFLDEVADQHGAVVLAGRCYERESVPYRAVDGLIDALCRYLLQLPRDQVERMLPHDVPVLARVFPVLRRVEAIARVHGPEGASPEPHELRRRAFAALRALLARLAGQRAVVLFIDDLQWGDVDSAPLLAGLMRPPAPPPLLFVASYRSEGARRSRLLRALLRREARLGPAARRPDLHDGKRTPDEAGARADPRRADSDAGAAVAATIANECDGNAYFLYELAQHVKGEGGRGAPGERGLTLDKVIRARVAGLPAPAQRLLEIAAVAGTPIAQAIATAAADIAPSDRTAVIKRLDAARLVHAAGVRDTDPVALYHDRIGETVSSMLDDERRREHHHRLAIAIQASERPDAERLAVHFRAAGELAAAIDYAVEAADHAADALAFDRAAELYRRALDMQAAGDLEIPGLSAKLGDALAHAGRGPDAAAAYLSAADEAAAPEQAVEMRRLAAHQYLRAGHLDDGIAALQTVLEAARLSLAPTPRRALWSLVRRRARLLLRGLRFRQRAAAEIPPRQLARIDLCWSAAVALGMIDTVRGADFQTQHLLLSLRAGEPFRIARALSVELVYASLPGRRGRRRTEAIVATTRQLAEQLDAPQIWGWFWASAALADYQVGHFAAAHEQAVEAVRVFRGQCRGEVWELSSAELYLLWSLFYRGELRQLRDRVQALLEEAHQHGDLYSAANLRTGLPNAAWLIADQPDQAMQQVDDAMREWSNRGVHLQHYWALLARTHIELYRGDAAAARERVLRMWPQLERAMLLRIQLLRIEGRFLRARCAIAAAADRGIADAEPLWRDALRDARAIERERMAWGHVLATLVRACVARARGEQVAAAELFERAEQLAVDCDMTLLAAVARRRRGELIGGHTGRTAVDEVDAWMREQAIERPDRFTALFAPG